MCSLDFILTSTDEEANLLKGINNYRASLNLTTLKKNDNAECLADELADQFKNQPCTNSTGANTVPGTEPQFANYPNLLAKCHLNVSNTRDGAVMPACVPNLVPNIVLTNFTQSLYSSNLNDTKYTGVGIGFRQRLDSCCPHNRHTRRKLFASYRCC
ncbi:peroxisomal adenine nucleotide carrier 1-like isoform X1 [Hibiscus syriacus]|uniref:Peroxisomal adenine nucleotide carrier 1-like isoform X1 n=1 Tax=Hibiscus syriacus TaxID=106335 RepID=A0A6A2Z4S6_HIBSY|nr:peroxisomal adenine nucleotide carrier 1-like isoform X1 [Hibiscus syriacus]